MIRLFNSFDIFMFSLQYVFLFAFMWIMLPILYRISLMNVVIFRVSEAMIGFFETLKPKIFSKFSFSIFLRAMILIFLLNFFSILPFNFSFTSQIRFVILISFSIWISFIIFQIWNNTGGFLRHLVPEGTPIYLTWFLFIIELVRRFIRPITLTVRLVANILAGHLLMILLSKITLKFLSVTIVYLGLNIVELFVALVQSYIFVTIICLYYSDVA